MVGSDLSLAKKLLTQGELVAIPTETVYGLAANAFNPIAVAKIFQAKNRPSFNPLIIHSNSAQRFEEWGIVFNDHAKKLAKQFWPGPLTMVVPKSDFVPDIVTAGFQNVAIRVPNHLICLDLLTSLDFPLAAPSANPSEYVSPTTAQHVQDQLGDQIAYILDGGSCNVGLESTIIDVSSEQPRLLRLGAISLEQIQEILQIEIQDVKNTSAVLAPGMMKRHYASRHPLFFEDQVLDWTEGNSMAIRFKNHHPLMKQECQIILSEKGDLMEAASKLFAVMRQLDSMNIDRIIAERFPDVGIGRAINDRLQRASSN